MKHATVGLFSILMAFALIFSMAGKAAAQETGEMEVIDAKMLKNYEASGASSSDVLKIDDAAQQDGDFKAFASTCTLKVFPESIRSGRLGRFGMFIVSGIEFVKGDTVDWGTDDINTILQFRFPQRIFSLVWIKANAEIGEYEVTVNDDNCTGTLEIR
jgi:hypothetical protein